MVFCPNINSINTSTVIIKKIKNQVKKTYCMMSYLYLVRILEISKIKKVINTNLKILGLEFNGSILKKIFTSKDMKKNNSR